MKVFSWDFDGTITVSNPLWTGCMVDALKLTEPNTNDSFFEIIRPYMAFGFPWHTPENNYSECTGDAWWELIEKHFCKSYIECGINPTTAYEAAAKVKSIITQKARYTIYDDAIETLCKLREHGAKNILLSNNYPELRIVLKALDIEKYFDEVIISAEVGYNKPTKEIFDIAKSKYPDADYYMIGDSINADMFGGKQNGMTTVLVHRGNSDEADYCCDNLSSIVELA